MRTIFICKFLVAAFLAAASIHPAVAATNSDAAFLQELRGKVVLLDFWASWCEPCRQSFPWMNDLQKRYGAEGLVVIAVNLDQDRTLVDKFLATTPAKFRIEFDANGLLATKFDVVAMPSSVVIDRTGRVREIHNGFKVAQRESREQSIVSLLRE